MPTNLPEITSSDLKAALDFLTGGTSEEPSAPPARPRRPANTVRPVVAVHHGINRARIRTATSAE